ncbi:MAG: hypothetical protein KJ025_02945 [Burkholderiales bacterium]|nr:hypothetical protein [Burkholderiales bacterium]
MDLPASWNRLPPAALAGAALGFGLWLLSPFLTGRAEPWDASFPFYLPAMLAGGAIAGTAFPRRAGAFFLGVWLGQVLAIAVLPGHGGDWFPVGAVTTAVGGTLALPTYLAASGLRARRGRPPAG